MITLKIRRDVLVELEITVRHDVCSDNNFENILYFKNYYRNTHLIGLLKF